VQALSISRSLREVEDAVRLGEADATVLEQRVHKAITSAGGKIDYAKVTRFPIYLQRQLLCLQEYLSSYGVCTDLLCHFISLDAKV
jgi:pantothenate synthetase